MTFAISAIKASQVDGVENVGTTELLTPNNAAN